MMDKVQRAFEFFNKWIKHKIRHTYSKQHSEFTLKRVAAFLLLKFKKNNQNIKYRQL